MEEIEYNPSVRELRAYTSIFLSLCRAVCVDEDKKILSSAGEKLLQQVFSDEIEMMPLDFIQGISRNILHEIVSIINANKKEVVLFCADYGNPSPCEEITVPRWYFGEFFHN